jgi:predicted nucleic acid-binding protein
MVLVDTSVWVAHLRDGNKRLSALLHEGHVLGHPLIIGELACGNLKNRRPILCFLQQLPMAAEARHEEVLMFIERHALMGKGFGWIDTHLLASAFLSKVSLWTFDKSLDRILSSLGMSHPGGPG